MEISLLPKGGLRVKGKQATLLIGTTDTVNANALLLFQNDDSLGTVKDGVLVVDGPGDYEVSGVKISSFRNTADLVYSLSVDGVDVLIGRVMPMEKVQSKTGEHQVVVLFSDEVTDASFAHNIVTNVLIFYGENGRAVAEKTAKGSVQEMSKYSVTLDKLPAEVETILLT